jgi:hypothetical protein
VLCVGHWQPCVTSRAPVKIVAGISDYSTVMSRGRLEANMFLFQQRPLSSRTSAKKFNTQFKWRVSCNGKVSFPARSGGKSPCILDLSTRLRWVYFERLIPEERAGLVSDTVWKLQKVLPLLGIEPASSMAGVMNNAFTTERGADHVLCCPSGRVEILLNSPFKQGPALNCKTQQDGMAVSVPCTYMMVYPKISGPSR